MMTTWLTLDGHVVGGEQLDDAGGVHGRRTGAPHHQLARG